MKVLAVGGSGRVASLVMPILKTQHELCVFDVRPPKDTSFDYIQGSVEDFAALTEAVKGNDALLYMAMGSEDWDDIPGLNSAFDVNIKGLYFALKTAAEAGIKQAVYTSSMSVYAQLMERYFPDEGLEPDETDLYGFTKYLGEHVCQNAARAWNLNINALRLCHPTAKEPWLEQSRKDTPTIATTADDVARAMLAALDYAGGYQAFMISGDYGQHYMKMAKAKRLLGWEPLARPVK